jgi:hypothetical protein
MKTQRGQGLIEFVVTTGLLLVLLFVGGPTAYFGAAKLWVRHCSYEALICLLEQQSPWACESRMNRDLVRLLRFGKLEKSWLRKFQNKVSSRVEFRVNRQLIVIEGMTLKNTSQSFVGSIL